MDVDPLYLVTYLDKAIQSFDADPPVTMYQRGYLAALENVRKEGLRPCSTVTNIQQ